MPFKKMFHSDYKCSIVSGRWLFLPISNFQKLFDKRAPPTPECPKTNKTDVLLQEG